MLMTAGVHRVYQIVPVAFQCEHCGTFHHAAIRFDAQGDAVPTKLADNCGCGASLDRPDVIRDLIGTARNLIEASYHVATFAHAIDTARFMVEHPLRAS